MQFPPLCSRLVFFRKHTQAHAQQLGLRGWCMNTDTGTVLGEMEGPVEELSKMKIWLAEVGSPKSHITKAIFSELRPIETYSFADFDVRR
jgi:acylphosphatase